MLLQRIFERVQNLSKSLVPIDDLVLIVTDYHMAFIDL